MLYNLNLTIMGNSHNQEMSMVVDSSRWNQWTKVEEQGFCELWMHKQTQQQLQAYPVPQSFARNHEQLKKYYFRKINHTYLVSVQAILTPSDSFLCTEPRMAYALVENIPNRLKKYRGSLSFEQALYVLATSAAGYNTLNSFFGPLYPHEDMICLNQDGKVKVWLNQNLSINEPSQTVKCPDMLSDDVDNAQHRTKECVDKLVAIVQSACSHPFSPDFKNQIRQSTTYFQIVNTVPYYCQIKGIDMAQRVVLPKIFQNPSFSSHKDLKRESSLQQFHQSNQDNFDISRVRTVVYRSVDIAQPQLSQHNPSLTQLQRPSVVVKNKSPIESRSSFSSIAQPVQSPKITFSIRSTLPAQIKPIPQSHTVSRPAPPLPPQARMTRVQVPKSHILPPQQQVVMERVERKQPQHMQMTFNPATKVKEEPVKQDQKKDESLNKQQKLEKSKPVSQSVKFVSQSVELKQEKQVEVKVVESSLKSNERLVHFQQAFEELKKESSLRNQSVPSSCQELSDKMQSNEETCARRPTGKFYAQPQSSLQEIQNEKRQDKQVTLIQILDDKPVLSSQQMETPKMQESQQSQIEPYTAPAHYQPKSPILQQQEEQNPTPRKESSQIEEWEAKLTKFTQSKHSQNNDPQTPQHSYQAIEQKIESVPETIKKPSIVDETDKELVSDPSEPSETQINPLASLNNEDIEQYIRAKYNLPQDESKSQSQSNKYIEQPYSSNYNEPYPSSYNYQPIKRVESYQEYNTFQYAPEPYTYQPTYQESNQVQFKGNYLTTFEKQNYQPYLRPQPFDRDRVSILLASEETTFRNPYNLEDKPFQKEAIKKRPKRVSNTTNIDERYSKYVLNNQRNKLNQYSRMTTNKDPSRVSVNNNKEVSLILAGGQSKISKISKISPKGMISELDQSSKRGINSFIVQGQSGERSGGVTYQKLRHFLMED